MAHNRLSLENEMGSATLANRLPKLKPERQKTPEPVEEPVTPVRSARRGLRLDFPTNSHPFSDSPVRESVRAARGSHAIRADRIGISEDYHFPLHRGSYRRSGLLSISQSNSSTPRRRPTRAVSTSSRRRETIDTFENITRSPYVAPLIIPDNEWPFKVNSGRKMSHRKHEEPIGSMQRRTNSVPISSFRESTRDSENFSISHRHSLFVYNEPDEGKEDGTEWRTFVSNVFPPRDSSKSPSGARRSYVFRRTPSRSRETGRHATPERVLFRLNESEAVRLLDRGEFSTGRSEMPTPDASVPNAWGAGLVPLRTHEVIVPERINKKTAGEQVNSTVKEQVRSHAGIPAGLSTAAGGDSPPPVEMDRGGKNAVNKTYPTVSGHSPNIAPIPISGLTLDGSALSHGSLNGKSEPKERSAKLSPNTAVPTNAATEEMEADGDATAGASKPALQGISPSSLPKMNELHSKIMEKLSDKMNELSGENAAPGREILASHIPSEGKVPTSELPDEEERLDPSTAMKFVAGESAVSGITVTADEGEENIVGLTPEEPLEAAYSFVDTFLWTLRASSSENNREFVELPTADTMVSCLLEY
ncbi:hypothetical protein MOQ_003670 [Trypanosoma cruzi marinkellei]|uniref:Uncharacterized protein n=1 Tax=Trypanosoma cruzi marinkellei TaxID=85056 RepID=K2NU34_TRYCR|nr:hypothetical protein MOQ_003670 [Trypanosoma cruzi marinkellei]